MKATGKKAKADDAVANDHDDREDGVAGKSRVALAAERDRHDERHFDDRHGDGQDERSERFAGFVRDFLGMKHCGDHCREKNGQYQKGDDESGFGSRRSRSEDLDRAVKGQRPRRHEKTQRRGR